MAVWRRLRALPSWLLPLLVAVVLLVLPAGGLDFATARHITLACVLALLVSGVNISLGYAGELALGQAAMYAAGAYTAGLLAKSGVTELPVQLLAGGVVALVVGLLTGGPGLRMGSWSLAMTSFFLVLILPDLLTIFSEQTGGRSGLEGMVGATLFGTTLTVDELYPAVLVATALWFVVARNVVTSRHGTAFLLLKRSPVLAAAMGISVFRAKLLAYALGALPAGLAGVLFANLDLYISPDAFGFVLATTVLAASILGGSTSVYGAAVGAFVVQFGPNRATDFEQYALVFTGLFLIVGGVLLKGGLASLARRAVARLDRAAGVRRVREPAPTDAALPEVAGKPLRVDGVQKAFGGNQALRGVTFAARPGRVTALIGPNGSGKTTLLNLVCGFYRTDAGTVHVGDRAVQGLPPHRVARAGVARTFQTPHIPPGVTVGEAVAAGRYAHHRASVLAAVLRTPHFRRVRRADVREAERVLELAGLAHLWDAEADSLPLGMRRLLEVARALISEPGVLLLDEVASGLDEEEVERLSELVRRIRDAGGTVVLVEHNVPLVRALADEVVVLAQGQEIAVGPPSEIEENPRVAREYLGLQGAATPATGGER